jgi:nucleotide-binding universal stress UspA family protein
VDEAVGVDIGLVSRKQETEDMKTFLEGVSQAVHSEIAVRTLVGFGSAARTILKQIESEDIDLVVLSSHGRGGFNRWICGSVAENVTRLSTVPVMLVRADTAHRERLEESENLDANLLNRLATSPEKLVKDLRT